MQSPVRLRGAVLPGPGSGGQPPALSVPSIAMSSASAIILPAWTYNFFFFFFFSNRVDSSTLASAAGERAFPAGHKAGGQGPGSPWPREGARSCSVHCVRDGAVTKARDPQRRAERAGPEGPSLRDPERPRGAAGKGGARAKVHRGPGRAGGARWGWGRRWGWGMPAWLVASQPGGWTAGGGKEAMQVPGAPFLPSPPQCGQIPGTNTPPGTPGLRSLLSGKK